MLLECLFYLNVPNLFNWIQSRDRNDKKSPLKHNIRTTREEIFLYNCRKFFIRATRRYHYDTSYFRYCQLIVTNASVCKLNKFYLEYKVNNLKNIEKNMFCIYCIFFFINHWKNIISYEWKKKLIIIWLKYVL